MTERDESETVENFHVSRSITARGGSSAVTEIPDRKDVYVRQPVKVVEADDSNKHEHRRRHHHRHHHRHKKHEVRDKEKEEENKDGKRRDGPKVSELWPKHWGAYDNNPDRDSLDGNVPCNTLPHSPNSPYNKGPNIKNKKKKPEDKPKDETSKEEEAQGASYKIKRMTSSSIWVVLSSLYGQLIVLTSFIFCLTEVMDNEIQPMQLQGSFLLYLYVGSIVAIMCIYISVVVDSCPCFGPRHSSPLDPEVGSMVSMNNTLRRAHISRQRVSRTSFHLRVGAIVFGLGTLVYNGLEIAMHITLNEDCVGRLEFAHPILQALFTFLQMHFLFVNSEVIVEKFGILARFGFMHLVATNVAVWGRLVMWEGAKDWFYNSFINTDTPTALALDGSGYPDYQILRRENGLRYLDGEVYLSCNRSSSGYINHMMCTHACFSNNALGQIWMASRQYLFPFIVQYSLIAAAITYVMWRSVGRDKMSRAEARKLGPHHDEGIGTLDARSHQHWRTDCQSSSKGLFLGLLCFVGGIIVLIIFFVMKGIEDFQHKMYWLGVVSNMFVMTLSIILSGIGFWQIPKLSVSGRKSTLLEQLLSFCTMSGVQLFGVFGIIVGVTSIQDSNHKGLIVHSVLLIFQTGLQSMLLADASQRTCSNRQQMLLKPGRQIITFLLFANFTLWGLDTFMMQSSLVQDMYAAFYGHLAWGILGKLAVPLMVFYRFYSCVILWEIWKNVYKTKAA